jgi:hypothetical protein
MVAASVVEVVSTTAFTTSPVPSMVVTSPFFTDSNTLSRCEASSLRCGFSAR